MKRACLVAFAVWMVVLLAFIGNSLGQMPNNLTCTLGQLNLTGKCVTGLNQASQVCDCKLTTCVVPGCTPEQNANCNSALAPCSGAAYKYQSNCGTSQFMKCTAYIQACTPGPP
jgi:hypothetical protein